MPDKETQTSWDCKHLKGTYTVPIFIDGDLSKSYIEIRCKECNQLIKVIGKGT